MAEYIEREAALKVLIENAVHCIKHFKDGEARGYKGAHESIFNLPIIEAEPVRHGRWIKTEQENACAVWTDYKCPVCGSVFDGNDFLFDKWKGCPVCLSRLDGGAGNG